ADQLTKLAIKGITISLLGIHVHGLPLGSSHPIIGDFLRITYIENPGMAFGIDIGGKLFFSVFSIVASIGILLYLYKARNENFLFRVSLALILGGAVGNLIDRVFYGVLFNDGGLFYGKVVDFIDADFFNVNLFGYHITRWPVFNIADASVTCGVILMMFAHRRKSEEEATMNVNSTGSTDMLGASVFSPDSSPSPSGPEPPQS
ncbi:MAG TPA: signal peptidase II, partial [Bacteroidota bacterium]|nr:signal peptidase II [Bacteroidota bacterium]